MSPEWMEGVFYIKLIKINKMLGQEGLGGPACRRFKSLGRVQRSVTTHGAAENLFDLGRGVRFSQNIAAKLAIGPTAQYHRDLIASLMQAEVFGATALSEPGVGSDFGGITTTAASPASM
jgi:hypothetical protein